MRNAIKAINECSIPNKVSISTGILTKTYYITCDYVKQFAITNLGLLYLALNKNEEITLKIESKQIKLKKTCQD